MNFLFFYQDLYFFLGQNDRAVTAHQHPMIQLVLGQEGPFLWKNPASGNWEEKKGFIVPPNHRHECDACGQLTLTIGVDTESQFGEHILQQYFQKAEILAQEHTFYEPLHGARLIPLIERQDWTAI
ncbi:MAG: hypothetical protein KDC44_23085, partial [Phaeodactylibacter sp.]|nr:hypothetical protein [Phaeodactylibacter sp.]